jgi:hypothetical protein
VEDSILLKTVDGNARTLENVWCLFSQHRDDKSSAATILKAGLYNSLNGCNKANFKLPSYNMRGAGANDSEKRWREEGYFQRDLCSPKA